MMLEQKLAQAGAEKQSQEILTANRNAVQAAAANMKALYELVEDVNRIKKSLFSVVEKPSVPDLVLKKLPPAAKEFYTRKAGESVDVQVCTTVFVCVM